MAYLSVADTKTIRNKIKEAFGSEYKFSIRNERFTSVCIDLMSSPLPFTKDHSQINHYYIQDTMKENPAMAQVMAKVFEIVQEIKPYYNRNAGDLGADYGDNTYFINLSVGKWNKAYTQIKK